MIHKIKCQSTKILTVVLNIKFILLCNPNFLELYNAKVLLTVFSKEADGNGLKFLKFLKSQRNCQKLDLVMTLNNL